MSDNSVGKELYSHCLQSSYYIYYPNEYTRFRQNINPVQPPAVDILLSNSCLHFSDLETHPKILQSDHVLISCVISGHDIFSSLVSPRRSAIRNWVDNQTRCQNIDQPVTNSGNLYFYSNKLISI